MRIRKLGIWFARSFLSMFIFGIIFVSLSDVSTKTTAKNLFEVIYEFSNLDAKTKTLDTLENVCDSILKKDDSRLIEVQEICRNSTALSEVSENCKKYYEMRASRLMEKNPDLDKTCTLVLSGELEARCKEIEKTRTNTTELGIICEQYTNKIINEQTFFSEFATALMPLPELGIGKATSNLFFISFIMAFLLLLILLILHKLDINEFLYSIGRIFFNLGVFVILSFLLLFIIQNMHPDTTVILESISSPNPDPHLIQKVMPTIILLVPAIFGKLLNIVHFVIGATLLITGIILKSVFKEYKI